MSNYHRAVVSGGYFFFTVVTFNRRPIFSDKVNIDRLRSGFRHVRARRPFKIDAIVLLPDHLHCIWELPQGDADFSTRWRLIKHYVSSGIAASINLRDEKPVWQRRYWEHNTRDEADWRRHMDYIHYNPVKHGYVQRPIDWEYGSFRQAVKRGWYGKNWGACEPSNIEGLDRE